MGSRRENFPCRSGSATGKGSGAASDVGADSTSWDSSETTLERGIRSPPGKEKPVALVDLGKVHRQITLPAFQRSPVRGDRRLHNIDFAVPKQIVRSPARREHSVSRVQTFFTKEPCPNGRN